MSTPAIRVENLGKRYKIGLREEANQTFREVLMGLATAPIRRLRGLGESTNGDDTIWALKDVSFEVQPGEVVGIIGRNGAGKTTLLKILSRITEPTEGRVELRGRVASLLEVGTGFHPELTGRENIYLNGAILGMKKAEIDRKFDEIVAFAETEKFLDTPVKRYSSGMYVRLAFAVAAHLEPDILLVDEVLAVGDVAFQKKCLGKMRDVATGGRTVLFISHNMAAVRSLCQTCVVIDRGHLVLKSTAEAGVAEYTRGNLAIDATPTVMFAKPRSGSPWMTHATLIVDGVPSASLPMGASLTLEVGFASDYPIRHPRLGFVILTATGDPLLNSNNRYQPSAELPHRVPSGRIRCDLGVVPFMPERYCISLWFGDHAHDSHVVENAMAFDVVERDLWGNGMLPPKASWMWWPTRFEFVSEEVEIVGG